MENLTKQEEDVMKCIWHLGRCSVRQIVELLPEPQPPYTTIASVVNNLKRKNFVATKRHGKGYVYWPEIDETEYKRSFMKHFVHDYFKSSFKEMVTFFAREEALSEKDLRDIISDIENQND